MNEVELGSPTVRTRREVRAFAKFSARRQKELLFKARLDRLHPPGQKMIVELESGSYDTHCPITGGISLN